MKSKLQYTYEIYKQSVDTSNFILLFCLLLVGSFFGVFGIAIGNCYLTGFFNIFWNQIYISFLLLIILLNTIHVYTIFNRNEFLIIRLQTKKEYLSQLIRTICFSNFILVLINIMFVMIFLNMFNYNAPLHVIKNYHMNAWIYAIFTLLKLLLLTQLISLLNTLFLKLCNTKIVIILNIIFYFAISLYSVPPIVISSIWQFPLNISQYFGRQEYSSFLFEVLCLLLYCSLLYFASYLLRKIVLRSKKDVLKS